jgi:hypothetical protein
MSYSQISEVGLVNRNKLIKSIIVNHDYSCRNCHRLIGYWLSNVLGNLRRRYAQLTSSNQPDYGSWNKVRLDTRPVAQGLGRTYKPRSDMIRSAAVYVACNLFATVGTDYRRQMLCLLYSRQLSTVDMYVYTSLTYVQTVYQ